MPRKHRLAEGHARLQAPPLRRHPEFVESRAPSSQEWYDRRDSAQPPWGGLEGLKVPRGVGCIDVTVPAASARRGGSRRRTRPSKATTAGPSWPRWAASAAMSGMPCGRNDNEHAMSRGVQRRSEGEGARRSPYAAVQARDCDDPRGVVACAPEFAAADEAPELTRGRSPHSLIRRNHERKQG